MTSDQELEQLKTEPPKVELTLRDRLWRAFGFLTAVIATTALTIAILVGINGTAIAGCINTNLGQRSAPSQKDAAAHIAFAALLRIGVTKSPPSADERKTLASAFGVTLAPGEFPTQAQFRDGVNAYERVLAADQKMRDTHPLGKC